MKKVARLFALVSLLLCVGLAYSAQVGEERTVTIEDGQGNIHKLQQVRMRWIGTLERKIRARVEGGAYEIQIPFDCLISLELLDRPDDSLAWWKIKFLHQGSQQEIVGNVGTVWVGETEFGEAEISARRVIFDQPPDPQIVQAREASVLQSNASPRCNFTLGDGSVLEITHVSLAYPRSRMMTNPDGYLYLGAQRTSEEEIVIEEGPNKFTIPFAKLSTIEIIKIKDTGADTPRYYSNRDFIFTVTLKTGAKKTGVPEGYQAFSGFLGALVVDFDADQVKIVQFLPD